MYLELLEHFVFAGKQEAVDATLMALEVIAEPLKSMAQLLVEVCAYAGNHLFCVEIFTIIIFFSKCGKNNLFWKVKSYYSVKDSRL